MLFSVTLITIVTLILVATAILQRLKLVTWVLIAGYVILITFMFKENSNSKLVDQYFSQNSQGENDLNSEVDSVFIQSGRYISSDLVTEVDISQSVSTGSLKINSISMTREIIEKTPGEISTQFNQLVGTINCFTSVFNLDDSTTISHIWKYKEQLISEIEIPIGVSVRWRCWSQLRVKPEWIGDWKVIVMNDEGQKLDSVLFQIVEETFSEF
jgi:hypothetical protein